jgi:DNA excision repair protein ERCC-6-like 2
VLILLSETVQVIAFLTAVFGKRGNENDKKRMRLARDRDLPYPRVLIICPGSVMSNWEREFSTVFSICTPIADRQWGWWHIAVYHGTNKSSNLTTASAGRIEILITTYTTYKQNQEKVNMVEWDIVIADECHIIKERKSDVTQQMAQVNSRVRIGLTGTAIQNNYEVYSPPDREMTIRNYGLCSIGRVPVKSVVCQIGLIKLHIRFGSDNLMMQTTNNSPLLGYPTLRLVR